MPALAKTRNDFLNVLADCRVLYRYCLAPRGQHSDPGVEAAFLQMFKGWESFQEDCTIAFMSGRLRIDGKSVACFLRADDEERARILLHQDRRFVEWTDVDKVIERWDRLFRPPSLLVGAVKPATTEMRQMAVVRNAIAHSSHHATERFKDLLQKQFGGKPSIGRPSQFLYAKYPPDPARTYFDRYADVLEVVANGMSG